MIIANSYEAAELLLRLFDLRREPELRKARNWFLENFYPVRSAIHRQFPQDGESRTYVMMVISYWQMVASILNRVLMDEEMFFENNGEMWVVWDRIRDVAPLWRAAQKDPYLFRDLEHACKRYEEYREKNAPGSTLILHRLIVGEDRSKRSSNW